jgi:hypothetical protein
MYLQIAEDFLGIMYEFRSNNLSTDNKFCVRHIFKNTVPQIFLGFKTVYDSVMADVLHNCVLECVFNVKLVILIKT